MKGVSTSKYLRSLKEILVLLRSRSYKEAAFFSPLIRSNHSHWLQDLVSLFNFLTDFFPRQTQNFIKQRHPSFLTNRTKECHHLNALMTRVKTKTSFSKERNQVKSLHFACTIYNWKSLHNSNHDGFKTEYLSSVSATWQNYEIEKKLIMRFLSLKLNRLRKQHWPVRAPLVSPWNPCTEVRPDSVSR